jgi:signal transduction histidine kinase
MSIRPLPRTLGGKFVLVVALGAVFPLALAGLWLTRAAERSGAELLRAQIDHAASAIAARIDQGWILRAGDLELLSSNAVARRLMSGQSITPADSAYLYQLSQSVSAAIPSIAYRDAAGVERWSFDRPSDRTPTSGMFSVTLPLGDVSAAAGTLRAQIALSSILSSDVAQGLVPDARLTILDAHGVPITGARDSLDLTILASRRAPGWEIASRKATAAPLEVVVAAPVEPYVAPFTRDANLGVGVLLVVALLALGSSVVLTRRITRSLEDLVDATASVAAGDLERHVDDSRDDETGRLARAFNAMTDGLRRTLSELAGQRALAAVGEFAASLAHEVRNSLTAVRVDLQHAKRHLPPGETGTALVTRALDSVRRLDSTVSSALRVARSGRVAKSPVDVNEIVRRAMASAAPTFEERGALLEPLHASTTQTIVGDESALEQLFLNLLLNAAQASPLGGRTMVSVESADSQVKVRVTDSGPGVHASVLSSVGTSFTTTRKEGTGLGLPIARRIAIAHGGDLTLETNPGSGTTALVQLPVW